MKAKYLLDTNQVSDALNPVSRVRDRINQARRAGLGSGTCFAVLCEVEVGIQQTRDPERNRRNFKRLLHIVKIWQLDQLMAQRFGEVYPDLKRRGRSLSDTDIVLATVARQHKLTLLTTDRDFEALPDIPTEDWTV